MAITVGPPSSASDDGVCVWTIHDNVVQIENARLRKQKLLVEINKVVPLPRILFAIYGANGLNQTVIDT